MANYVQFDRCYLVPANPDTDAAPIVVCVGVDTVTGEPIRYEIDPTDELSFHGQLQNLADAGDPQRLIDPDV